MFNYFLLNFKTGRQSYLVKTKVKNYKVYFEIWCYIFIRSDFEKAVIRIMSVPILRIAQ